MMFHRFAAVLLAGSLATLGVSAQSAPQASIMARMKTLRSLPNDERASTTRQLALDVRALPPSPQKVQLADDLAGLSTESDPGLPILTDVTLTLAEALKETPVAPGKPGEIPEPYMEVASLVRYEGVTVAPRYLQGPLYAEANRQLDRNDADVRKADFTLMDLDGKPVTLSQLRGKVVMVNFWATWCPPCRKEMPELSKLQQRFKSQGLVILSISDEDRSKVAPFIAKTGYTPVVLLDPGRKANDEFHVLGIPKSFVFDRQGKLVATTIDERSERQFLAMFAAAGIQE